MTPAAFDHLARCRRCELELTEIAQTVVALRRLGERASVLEPPNDGWRELRARLETSRRRSYSIGRSRWALVGSMLGSAMVAVLVVRVAVVAGPAGAAWTSDGLAEPSSSSEAVRPLYDPGPRLLTEGIVLILGGRAQAPDGPSAGPLAIPSSTDRRDVPRVIHRTTIPPKSTPPRAATRS